MRVVWVANCLGIGGADRFMLEMVRWLSMYGVTTEKILSTAEINNDVWGSDALHSVLSGIPKGVQVVSHTSDSNHIEDLSQLGIIFEDCADNVIFRHLPAYPVPGTDRPIVLSWCTPVDWVVRRIGEFYPWIDIVQNCDESAIERARNISPVVDAFCVTSKAIASDLEDLMKPIYYLPNCYSSRVTPYKNPHLSLEIRRHLGIEEDAIVFLFMSRMVHEKNPAYMVRLVNTINERTNMKAYGLFVGSRPVGKTPTEVYYMTSCSKYRERFLFLDHVERIWEILAVADMMVLVSDFEGLPLSVLEALYSGVPCLVSDLPYVSDLQDFGIDLLVVPRRSNPEGDFPRVLEYLSQYARSGKQERNSRIVASYFSPQVISSELHKIMLQVLVKYKDQGIRFKKPTPERPLKHPLPDSLLER